MPEGGRSAGSTALTYWQTKTSRRLTADAVASQLRQQRFVLLGEKHDNPAHHQGQAALIAALVRHGRRPAIVFEMITQAEQQALNRFVEQESPRAEALGPAVRWEERGWPAWELYLPIARVALDAGLPLLAGGISREELRARLAQHEPVAPPSLPEDQRRALLEAVRDAHCGYVQGAALEMMARAQQLRDAHMARQLVRATNASDGGVVMIAGNGHARRDRGIPFHLEQTHEVAQRQIGVVSFIARDDPPARVPADGPMTELHEAFDYVAFTARHDKQDPCERFREQLERMKHHPGKSGAASAGE
jgi:uncharacterized iron-regulated protein